MTQRRGSSVSETSSTLSEFVRRRYNGDVPVFGGDPRVGAAELGSAVSTTVTNQLANALSGINDTLRRLDVRPAAAGVYTPPRRPQILMRNMDPSVGELRDAENLDDDQIRMLLDASLVSSQDVARYFTLLTVARDSIKKKSASMEAAKMRKAAALRVDNLVSDDEIAAAYGNNLAAVDAFAAKLGFETLAGKCLLRRALVHDSRFSGRSTNRSLAHVGDSVLATVLKAHACANDVTVGDASGMVSATQSNVVMRELGVKYKLDMYMISGLNVDNTSRTVMATALEAIFGAAYMYGGVPLVLSINDKCLQVCNMARVERFGQPSGGSAAEVKKFEDEVTSE